MTKKKQDKDQASAKGGDRSVLDQFVDFDALYDRADAEVPVGRAQEDVAGPETAELHDRLLRALAEAENARKRADAAREQGRTAGVAETVKAILPGLDSLILAASAARQKAVDGDPLWAKHVDGLEAVAHEFEKALQRLGVEVLRPMGELFDPKRHEAIAVDPEADGSVNRVVRVEQPGYMIAERLIRPARVVVGDSSTGN